MCKEVFYMYDIVRPYNKESEEAFIRTYIRLVCDNNCSFKERQGDTYFPYN